MSYSVEQHLTKINKGKKGANKPEWIIFHFVGATGQARANARYFESVHRGASSHYFVDPKEIVQVVEDDTPAWHIGDGARSRKGPFNGYVNEVGATNHNSIGIEVCQDVTTGDNVWNWDFHPETLNKVVWLIKQLQKKYNIDDAHVIRHFDASGKICPGNWQHNNWAKWFEFKGRLEKGVKQPAPAKTPKVDQGRISTEGMYLIQAGDTLSGISKQHGVTVDNLIAWNDLENPNLIFPETHIFIRDPKASNYPVSSDIEKMARDVLAGKYGNGEERRRRLGNNFDAVQAVVNSILLGRVSNPPKQPTHTTPTAVATKPVQPAVKTINQLADEVIRGLHGSGRERMISLGNQYVKVQQEVNRRLRNR